MGSDRFALVKEILIAVADLGETERAAYLDKACKDAPEMRQEIEALLARRPHSIVSRLLDGLFRNNRSYSPPPRLRVVSSP